MFARNVFIKFSSNLFQILDNHPIFRLVYATFHRGRVELFGFPIYVILMFSAFCITGKQHCWFARIFSLCRVRPHSISTKTASICFIADVFVL